MFENVVADESNSHKHLRSRKIPVQDPGPREEGRADERQAAGGDAGKRDGKPERLRKFTEEQVTIGIPRKPVVFFASISGCWGLVGVMSRFIHGRR
ncbi:hypothetical protein HTV45_15945 [Streptomyces sp. CHD11]|uniref:hypothetical protein n=1 Tax=Streptomyces sp. CHD11 TaxID=2741325 RepID=UPI001BFC3F31|nr:hypothetical protein [Streptomyces sp. CHD11]MBT3152353.1 hypothetical protein [Streptomyces sp. CHD11]